METKRLFTSESVTEGHPDKMCDTISDAILDACLEEDPDSRVACETVTCTGFVIVTGEISTEADIDVPKIVRDTVKEIGYTSSDIGFDGNSCAVFVALDQQSPDIAMGVDSGKLIQQDELVSGLGLGAGDQGIMFGYATNETSTYMPSPIHYAHQLALKLTQVRKSGEISYLRPDGKTQVTMEYDGTGMPFRVDTIVISTQHDDNVTQEQIREDLINKVINTTVDEKLLQDTKIFINPTGRFVIGGPQGDAGLTGRKIVVDTYGGWSRVGGGCFSGKDPSKVDRSAAYAARYVAKNLVAAEVCDRCEIQLSYAIGVAEPTSIAIDTFGTTHKGITDDILLQVIKETFDLRPNGIIHMLDLQRPIYTQTAAYGHFGRTDVDLPWEKLDQVDTIKTAIQKYIDAK